MGGGNGGDIYLPSVALCMQLFDLVETPQLCNTTRARGQSPPSTCRFSDIFLKPFRILM